MYNEIASKSETLCSQILQRGKEYNNPKLLSNKMKLSIGFLLASAGKPGSVLAATCGNGNRGDGICAGGLCCSKVRN
jgi:hypothetical protein